jgi:hypothetical protein
MKSIHVLKEKHRQPKHLHQINFFPFFSLGQFLSQSVCKDGGVMNILTKLVQRHLRRPTRPVYQQLELPLGAVRLDREQWQDVLRLAEIRRELARL